MTSDSSHLNSETLGSKLRRRREERRLSLDQASSATKISVKILIALETDHYEDLPAAPFVRGFLKTYARFIGFSPDALIAEHEQFLQEKLKERRNRDVGRSGYAFEKPEGEQSRKVLWSMLGGMFVLGLLVIFVFKPNLKSRKHGHVDQLRAEASPTPLPSVAASLSPAAPPLAALATDQLPQVTGTSVEAPNSSSSHATPVPTQTSVVVAAKEKTPVAPVVAAVPTVVPVATSTPVADAKLASTRADPLQNGSDYEAGEVKYKSVFKALTDVTVQYLCDDKNLMRFTLRKDRILVLRGKEMVRLQVSNPRALGIVQGTRGYVPVADTGRIFDYRGNATIVWPADAKGKMGEKFNQGTQLAATPDPLPEPKPEESSLPASTP